MRNIDPALALIKEFEGFESKPYLDSVGIPTIGIGTTAYPDGTKVTMKDRPVTLEQAYTYLKNHLNKDIETIEAFLSKNNIKLNDNQFSALLCFSYNVGVSPIVSKGRTIREGLLKNSVATITQGIQLYDKAAVNGNRVALAGLTRRRKAECKLYLS